MAFFTVEQAAHLAQSGCRKAELVEFRFASETVRLWNGNRKLEAGGETWLALGALGSIDGLEETRSPESHQVTFTLSGIALDQHGATALDSIVGAAIAETSEVEGRHVVVYMQLFDGAWQTVGNPNAFWFGMMFPPKVTRSGARGSVGGVRTVALPAENLFYGRSRPAAGRYTDRDQQTRFPGDRFFERTPENMHKSHTWPTFTGQ